MLVIGREEIILGIWCYEIRILRGIEHPINDIFI